MAEVTVSSLKARMEVVHLNSQGPHTVLPFLLQKSTLSTISTCLDKQVENLVLTRLLYQENMLAVLFGIVLSLASF